MWAQSQIGANWNRISWLNLLSRRHRRFPMSDAFDVDTRACTAKQWFLTSTNFNNRNYFLYFWAPHLIKLFTYIRYGTIPNRYRFLYNRFLPRLDININVTDITARNIPDQQLLILSMAFDTDIHIFYLATHPEPLRRHSGNLEAEDATPKDMGDIDKRLRVNVLVSWGIFHKFHVLNSLNSNPIKHVNLETANFHWNNDVP